MMRNVCCVLLLAAGAALQAWACEKSPPRPATSYEMTGPVRFLSLTGAVAVALEHGAVGQPSLLFPGICIDSLVQGPGYQVLAGRSADPRGIVIVRKAASKQDRLEFERRINQTLLNVETAYWNLYGSYHNLHSRERGLRLAFKAWKLARARYQAGSSADCAQCRGQYELFRAQRLAAIDQVRDNERQLRSVMGLPVEDGTRLVPCDTPTTAEYKPDWKTALNETMARRPDLLLARRDTEARGVRLIITKVIENLAVWGLETATTRQLYEALGLRPVYVRLEDNPLLCHGRMWFPNEEERKPKLYSGQQLARLELFRSCAVLQDQEMKAERFLGLEYRRISSSYEQIRTQRAQREALAAQLRERDKEVRDGKRTVDILLEAQRFWADALANEHAAVVQYNNARCAFDYAKGTIQHRDHVTIVDHPPAEPVGK